MHSLKQKLFGRRKEKGLFGRHKETTPSLVYSNQFLLQSPPSSNPLSPPTGRKSTSDAEPSGVRPASPSHAGHRKSTSDAHLLGNPNNYYFSASDQPESSAAARKYSSQRYNASFYDPYDKVMGEGTSKSTSTKQVAAEQRLMERVDENLIAIADLKLQRGLEKLKSLEKEHSDLKESVKLMKGEICLYEDLVKKVQLKMTGLYKKLDETSISDDDYEEEEEEDDDDEEEDDDDKELYVEED